VPFEERPFDHWIVTLIKAIYKPTQYFWRREPKILDIFNYKRTDQNQNESTLDLAPYKRQRIQDYLVSIDQSAAQDPFSLLEQSRLASIMAEFQTVIPSEVDARRQAASATITVSTHSLTVPSDQQPQTDVTENTYYYEETIPHSAPTPKPGLAVGQVANEIVIPEMQLVQTNTQQLAAVDTSTTPVQASEQVYSEAVAEPVVFQDSATAAVNADLPFPVKPTEPNKLVGMVLTPRNELINDAIVEIIDGQGQVSRAVKTNALGQFFITTPLNNGNYSIITEKDNFQFSPLQIDLTGQAVEPLEIRSIN
jgi:hypothetical protein